MYQTITNKNKMKAQLELKRLNTRIYTVEHNNQIYVFSRPEKAERFFKLKKRYPRFIFNILKDYYNLC